MVARSYMVASRFTVSVSDPAAPPRVGRAVQPAARSWAGVGGTLPYRLRTRVKKAAEETASPLRTARSDRGRRRRSRLSQNRSYALETRLRSAPILPFPLAGIRIGATKAGHNKKVSHAAYAGRFSFPYALRPLSPKSGGESCTGRRSHD